MKPAFSPSAALAAAVPGVSTQIVHEYGEWVALRDEWNGLFESSPAAVPPLHWEWLDLWWRTYAPESLSGGAELRVALARRGGRLVGGLPLYAGLTPGPKPSLRRLAFLSSGEAECEETCPAYLNLLHLPGEDAACATALRAALLEVAGEWDAIRLSRIPAGSPLESWRRGMAPLARVERRLCHVADISGGLQAYLGRLSRNSRKKAARLLRQVEESGLRLELAATERQAEEFFEQLVDLHQAHWTASGFPGCFASEKFTRFHRELHRRWVPPGRALLARLSAGSQPLAVLNGFVQRDRCHLYLSGVRRGDELPVRSPGTAADLLLIEHLSARGIREYNFLEGADEYKRSLSTRAEETVSLDLFRPTLRTTARFTAGLLRRVSRLCLRGRNPAAAARQPPARPECPAGAPSRSGASCPRARAG